MKYTLLTCLASKMWSIHSAQLHAKKVDDYDHEVIYIMKRRIWVKHNDSNEKDISIPNFMCQPRIFYVSTPYPDILACGIKILFVSSASFSYYVTWHIKY